jgi:hypothetical protein
MLLNEWRKVVVDVVFDARCRMLLILVHALCVCSEVWQWVAVLVLVLNVHIMMVLLFGTRVGDMFLLLKLLLSRRNNLFQRAGSTATDLDSVLLIFNSVLNRELFYKRVVTIFKGIQFVFQFSCLGGLLAVRIFFHQGRWGSRFYFEVSNLASALSLAYLRNLVVT